MHCGTWRVAFGLLTCRSQRREANIAQALQALLWDVDGTLAETEFEGHRTGFNLAFQEVGLPWHWDRHTYRELLSVSGGRERLTAHRARRGEAPWSREELEQLMGIKQRHYIRLVAEGAVALRAGVAPLIAEVQADGIPQAIVTTSSRSAVAALMEGLGPSLAGAFAFWICGEEVARKKPDPQGYQMALTQLALDPESVLAIEDSVAGLEAATAAGLRCLITLSELSRQERPETFAKAVAVIDSLEVGGPSLPLVDGPARDQPGVTLTALHQLVGLRR
jgi:HAD superfamily hydrolase (TIGR01509 family)